MRGTNVSVRDFFYLFIFCSSSVFAGTPAWKDLPDSSTQGRLFSLDIDTFVSNLDSHTASPSAEPVILAKAESANWSINLPLPEGDSIRLVAKEYSIMEEGAESYNGFRSWKVQGVDDPSVRGVIDVSSSGFHAMISLADGKTVFIEPDAKGVNKHVSYYKGSEADTGQTFKCATHSNLASSGEATLKHSPIIAQRAARDLKTYRIAMAATGEFTAFYGSKTAAMNAISSIINTVNFIYERDLGISLRLIANNGDIVFTNSLTDPYINTDKNRLEINTAVLNSVIGSGAYDVGHVLTRIPGQLGGVAILGSVCGGNKGAGTTGATNPRSSTFAVDFVAHEIGHQLGATHTFNSNTGSCSGGNRFGPAAFEPGSGSSVMAYAGICGVNNIADHSLPVFHIASITQIDRNIRNAGDCAINTGSNNQQPEISSVTTNLTVNAGESFTLTGIASDPDGDALLYSWDQVDAGTVSDKFVDEGDNAIFEVKPLSSSPSRTFVRARALTNRTLTFEFVVRDGKGGISSRTTSVNVINGSPPNTRPSSGNSDGGGGGSLGLFQILWLFGFMLLVKKQIRRKQR